MNTTKAPILEWDKPMTSKQAGKYLLTKGFVAAEAYEALLIESSGDKAPPPAPTIKQGLTVGPTPKELEEEA